jgi:hypothetical protein
MNINYELSPHNIIKFIHAIIFEFKSDKAKNRLHDPGPVFPESNVHAVLQSDGYTSIIRHVIGIFYTSYHGQIAPRNDLFVFYHS